MMATYHYYYYYFADYMPYNRTRSDLYGWATATQNTFL